jgi:DNA-binding MarR family transcriptional regulator
VLGATGDDADGEIVDLLFQVMGLMKHRFIAGLVSLELTPQQAHALRSLQPGRPLAMRDLAADLMCDASTVTGLVDRLEQRGLVERHPDASDRRVKALVLTAAGIDTRRQVVSLLMTSAPHRAALDPVQRAELRDLLRRMVAADHPA